ncbi:transcriptional regulator [Methanosphaerula palustris]|uniref:Regulatory protein, ArsR n=1 Tax=Methanosphaerula palustris (strain ATCC BAA-1556 / DSM 19958 / E1-9c) TaxID=521011 RepID=B8GDJ5_METPE|nr:transcriptional regulator [Methanosphaerula palustris]ACL17346.1 regulatory protein, ArsR [Methanosphaerula palustris E1-9c]
MQDDILSILNESEALNAKVFSLVRLKLLASLAALGRDGATYRELKAALTINDGVLFANLNVLKDMGYLTSEKITSDGKELELYTITPNGQDEWKRVKTWLCRFLGCGA